jgi:hypothetical protein
MGPLLARPAPFAQMFVTQTAYHSCAGLDYPLRHLGLQEPLELERKWLRHVEKRRKETVMNREPKIFSNATRRDAMKGGIGAASLTALDTGAAIPVAMSTASVVVTADTARAVLEMASHPVDRVRGVPEMSACP